MVRLNPDFERLKQLDGLRKEKIEKERELKAIQSKKEEELKDVERKLEEAVADLVSGEEEESEEPTIIVQPSEIQNLEETIAKEKIEEIQSGPVYKVQGDDLQDLRGLYDRVKNELTQGRTDSEAVQNAKDIIYELNKGGYVSTEARERAQQDAFHGEYINRIGSLLEIFENQSGSLYKN